MELHSVTATASVCMCVHHTSFAMEARPEVQPIREQLDLGIGNTKIIAWGQLLRR